MPMKLGWQPTKWLEKKGKLGMRGYPIGTVAFYGPDDQRATKVVAAILTAENQPADLLRKWFCENGDVRNDKATMEQVAQYLREAGARSIAMTSNIYGCPHEEGIDYADGEACPTLPILGRPRSSAPPSERLMPGRISRGKRNTQPSVVRTRVSNWSP
jgi:hypothetical protein